MKHCPQQDRVPAGGDVSASEDFDRNKAAQFAEPQLTHGLVDLLEHDRIREHERKIPLHSWITREGAVARFSEIMLVQAVEKQFRHEHVLSQLPSRRPIRMQLSELGN